LKLLAPIRNSLEIEPLLQAGADEFYCGISPPAWQERFGQTWVNRRSPGSAGVADLEDFRRIVTLAAGHPVHVTLNAPSYPAGAMEMLTEFAASLLGEGAAGLIVADMDLLLTLTGCGLDGRIHLSSLAACTNPGAASFFQELGVSRIILPRHVTLAEIENIIIPGMEFEVFLLNDGCVFEEGLCATTHAAGTFCLNDGEETMGISGSTLEDYEFWRWTLNHCGCRTNRGYPVGPCGLCALPRLRRAGVTSLKVVGREASLTRKEAAVRLAFAALQLAEKGADPGDIRGAVIDLRGVPSLCQGGTLCYYPDVWDPQSAGEVGC
jgi:U32 family peptidase